MAQESAMPEFTRVAEAVRPRYAALASARATSAADLLVNLDFVRDYQRYLRATPELDPAGPGAMVTVLRAGRRLVVDGTVIAVTEQVPRVTSWLAGLGASVVSQEDDGRIGVSRLRVDNLNHEQMYAALRQSRGDVASGALPLEVSLDDVTYENGVTFKPVTPQSGSGAAQRISMNVARPTGTGRGAGITVAVIDGGFESDGAPPRTDGWTDNVVPPTDGRPRLDNQNAGSLDPGAGHGAFVTGVLAQRAPDATIRQYRAVDSFGFGSTWRLKDCLLQAVADGAQVVNISLGFEDPDLFGSPALSAALHTIPSSILVVASAGNSGTAVPMLPASHKATIGVGGLEGDLDPVAWSNFGPWVDFSAVAIPVTSTYVVDPADPAADPNPWAVWAGTSFSGPKVAGELAALLSTGLSASDAVERLRGMAVRAHPSPDYGYLLDLPDDLDTHLFSLAFPDPGPLIRLREGLVIQPWVRRVGLP